MGGGSKYRLGEAGLAKALDLLMAAEFFDAKVGPVTGFGSIRIAGMPARPSMAAAVEPARPPPTIAMSVYRMVCLRFAALSLRRKGKQTLS